MQKQTKYLQQKSAIYFAQHFHLVPNLYNQEYIKGIFMAESKQGSESTMGLNYEEFLGFLTKIAVSGKKDFEHLYSWWNKGGGNP